ncbi:MAG TPA: NAD(P)H-quinone oxidoreductase [Actinoplanes sp.]|nr:NAD(P)H-quinone oxidoreductase [Actinoplanes sp.]
MSDLRTERPAASAARSGDPFRRLRRHLREPYLQLLAAQVLTGGVALAANLLMVRAMSPSGRGEVALMLQVVYLATQVLLLGTERSFVATYHDVPPATGVKAYARLLAVPAALCLTVAVAVPIVAPDRFHPGAAIVLLLACYAMVEATSLATRSIAVAAGRVHEFLIARIIESVLLLVLLVVLFAGAVADPAVWVLAYVFSGLVPTAAYVVRWLRLPAPGPGPDSPTLNRHVRREGLTLFPAALSNMAMLRVDRLALPALASTSALGLYAAVATMTELLAWPLRAFADSRLGKWRAADRGGALNARPVILAAAAYALVVAPVAAGALYLLIVPVFGADYAPAKAVVVPLVAAAGLYAVSRISLGLLIAQGHGALVSTAEIAGFAVSFVAYLVLIPRYGILGAAYGSLLGYGACLLFAIVAGRFAASRTPVQAEGARSP